jgi:hypothetical protein
LERHATEIEFKTKAIPWRAWRCSLCANLFATIPHDASSNDGKAPQCCPYCGQIFEGLTEFR